MLDVFNILSKLGIACSSSDLKGNELKIACPFHAEKTIGAFSINIETWQYNCFSCLTKGISPEKFIMDYLNISYKETKDWLETNCLDYKEKDSAYTDNIQDFQNSLNIEYKDQAKTENLFYYPQNLKYIDVNNYFYLKSHKISQIFVNMFKWSYCSEGYYKDYIIIPIYRDNKLFSFEARKLKEYEKLCEYYNIIPNFSYRQYSGLKKLWKEEGYSVDKNGFIYKHKIKQFIEDKNRYFLIKYLLKPKVLYPKGSKINTVLFNQDNLKYDKTLYLVESLSSIPNVWMNKSENVTSIFGAKISSEQIKELNKFKKIVVYPDLDEAGFLLLEKLMNELIIPSFVIEVEQVETASKKELNQETILISRYIFRKIKEFTNEFENF